MSLKTAKDRLQPDNFQKWRHSKSKSELSFKPQKLNRGHNSLTEEETFEVSCEFSKSPLNRNSHQLHSNAISIESKWRQELFDVSCVSDVVVAELSKQNLNQGYPEKNQIFKRRHDVIHFCGDLILKTKIYEGNFGSIFNVFMSTQYCQRYFPIGILYDWVVKCERGWTWRLRPL